MTLDALVAVLGASCVGFAIGAWRTRRATAAPPQELVRTNVSGMPVPAVLGAPVTAGAVVALGAVGVAGAIGWDAAAVGRTGIAAGLVVVVMAVAGAMDDRRGDEASRGFSGHLAALRAGKLTGGVVKVAAGGLAAAATAALLFWDEPAAAAATLLLVPLGSNTINLLDRAPGRAGKVFLLVALPLMVLGDVRWALAAAGAVGALVACLPFDLGEKAMLGDAGANPLGALAGLGLAVSLGGPWRWVAVAALVALNVASERWSFSRAIETTPWLRRLDRIGRK